ncbi:hypothetical protein BUALT_Bualt12G0128600 [Buddleja alternifolia]|uniref:Uncharacterized protein n=1 Tax=Buddleja alternifolia TaxID=168488 RepID=A0AAV6WPS5_9LAMI|nr:hypothetical protein BUALT_Bualt12G0128600 [Buddleja alternifolia]
MVSVDEIFSLYIMDSSTIVTFDMWLGGSIEWLPKVNDFNENVVNNEFTEVNENSDLQTETGVNNEFTEANENSDLQTETGVNNDAIEVNENFDLNVETGVNTDLNEVNENIDFNVENDVNIDLYELNENTDFNIENDVFNDLYVLNENTDFNVENDINNVLHELNESVGTIETENSNGEGVNENVNNEGLGEEYPEDVSEYPEDVTIENGMGNEVNEREGSDPTFDGNVEAESESNSSDISDCPSWMLEDLKGPDDNDIFATRPFNHGNFHIDMFKAIKRKCMNRIQVKKAGMEKYQKMVCPKILNRIEKQRYEGRHYCPSWAGDDKFEVRHFMHNHIVYLNERHYSCGILQLCGFPCCHAISCINEHWLDIDDFVDDYVKKDTYLRVYSHMVNPVPGMHDFEESSLGVIDPPNVKVRMGRQKKKRIWDGNDRRDPTKVSRRGLTHTCQICLQLGHNKASCTSLPHPNFKYTVNPSQRDGPPPNAPTASMNNEHAGPLEMQSHIEDPMDSINSSDVFTDFQMPTHTEEPMQSSNFNEVPQETFTVIVGPHASQTSASTSHGSTQASSCIHQDQEQGNNKFPSLGGPKIKPLPLQ